MSAARTFLQLLATITINDVMPRAKRAGRSVAQFIEPGRLHMIALYEYVGLTTRRDTRVAIDDGARTE